ncbi:MAG: ribose 5-phosphate isomerase B [bacterium]|nr:ribose 5-phosphate isomerase B [bacterium]
MKIAIGSDHAGYELKEELMAHLSHRGFELVDFGTYNGDTSVDYPDYAEAVAREVSNGEFEKGILVCGTGIGVAIAANKVKGIRAANCNEVEMAVLSRRHNDANILTIGGRVVDHKDAQDIASVWLSTEFEGERHIGRIQKISDIEVSS